MAGPRDSVNRALSSPNVAAPDTWGEAREKLFGGSTHRTAEAAGVSQRSVQRWIAAEEGRSVQSRTPNPARLSNVGRRANLERIRDGTPVSVNFAGDIRTRSGAHRGRRGRESTQWRDMSGSRRMDPESAREWAMAELADDPEAMSYLSEAMFGADSDYPIPPSPDYAALARIQRFELSIG